VALSWVRSAADNAHPQPLSRPATVPLARSLSRAGKWQCFGVPFPEPDEVGSGDGGQAPASGGGNPEFLGCFKVARRWGARATNRDLDPEFFGLGSAVVTR
jgi:hypothetical protein